MNNVLLWKKLKHNAIIPQYQTANAAGFDFHAIVNNPNNTIWIDSQQKSIVDTGLSVAIPTGWQIEIRPRSGLALKYSITIVNSPGTVDSDYRGPIKIILFNLGKETFRIKNGDRIAQGVIVPAPQFKMQEVDELPESERGENGFGSTGVK